MGDRVVSDECAGVKYGALPPEVHFTNVVFTVDWTTSILMDKPRFEETALCNLGWRPRIETSSLWCPVRSCLIWAFNTIDCTSFCHYWCMPMSCKNYWNAWLYISTYSTLWCFFCEILSYLLNSYVSFMMFFPIYILNSYVSFVMFSPIYLTPTFHSYDVLSYILMHKHKGNIEQNQCRVHLIPMRIN